MLLSSARYVDAHLSGGSIYFKRWHMGHGMLVLHRNARYAKNETKPKRNRKYSMKRRKSGWFESKSESETKRLKIAA